jgi:hypothetical protein
MLLVSNDGWMFGIERVIESCWDVADNRKKIGRGCFRAAVMRRMLNAGGEENNFAAVAEKKRGKCEKTVGLYVKVKRHK